MRVQLVILLVVFCLSVSYSAVIGESDQKELLDYQSKINILQHLLTQCGSFNDLSDLPEGNLSLLKLRYRKLVNALSACNSDKSKLVIIIVRILENRCNPLRNIAFSSKHKHEF